MTDVKTIIRNTICVFLSILLIAAIGYMVYTDRQEENSQTASAEAAEAEARPYENELQELRTELDNLQSDVSYSSEEAEIMVGFLISAETDLSYVEEKAATYGFSPIIVIDCTMETEVIEAVVAAANPEWELMLYATNYSEDTNEDVVSVISYLESAERQHTGVFFLREDDRSDSNIQLLADDGFVGYTYYHSDALSEGQTEEGLIYFEYSHLATTDTVVTSRLSALYSGKSSMIIVFDMDSINAGTLTETYVTALFDTMQSYTEKENCVFSAVADVVSELSEVNAIEAENQANYEEQKAELQERIEELEETIAAIYDK